MRPPGSESGLPTQANFARGWCRPLGWRWIGAGLPPPFCQHPGTTTPGRKGRAWPQKGTQNTSQNIAMTSQQNCIAHSERDRSRDAGEDPEWTGGWGRFTATSSRTPGDQLGFLGGLDHVNKSSGQRTRTDCHVSKERGKERRGGDLEQGARRRLTQEALTFPSLGGPVDPSYRSTGALVPP